MSQQIDFEIPASVRDLASKSVEQAHEAYNRFIEATRQAQEVVAKSTDVIATGAREINEKAVKYTEPTSKQISSSLSASFMRKT